MIKVRTITTQTEGYWKHYNDANMVKLDIIQPEAISAK